MTPSTTIILAKHALGSATTSDYINWAISTLSAGADSPNLRILAGIDLSEPLCVVEPYFIKVKKELGLPSPTKDESLLDYSLILASQILDSTTDYASLVSQLSTLCYTHNYPDYLMEWYFLDDGLTDIADGYHPHTCEKLYRADPLQIVRKAAFDFISRNRREHDSPPNGPAFGTSVTSAAEQPWVPEASGR